MRDAIEKITAAEIRAEEIISEGQVLASIIAEKADSEGKEIIKNAVMNAMSEKRRIIEKSEQYVEEHFSRAKASAIEDGDKIRKMATLRMNQTVDMIVDRILGEA